MRDKLSYLTKHGLRCHDDAITLLNASKHGGRLQISCSDYLWRMWRRIGWWGPFSETNFTFCWCVLKLFSWVTHPSRRWLHTFHLQQCCWMQWVPHVTACVQGTYVVCSSKGIPWIWGMSLLRGEIKQLVVKWKCTLFEFHHSYNDVDHIDSYSGRLELQLSLY